MPLYRNLSKEHLENIFTYHAPKKGQPEIYEEIRGRAKELAYYLVATCPSSLERTEAIKYLETTVFWANAAIARHGD